MRKERQAAALPAGATPRLRRRRPRPAAPRSMHLQQGAPDANLKINSFEKPTHMQIQRSATRQAAYNQTWSMSSTTCDTSGNLAQPLSYSLMST